MAGRFLLVTVHSDLDSQLTTHNAVMRGIQHVPGVVEVVDLRAITARTLCSFLMSDEEFAAGMAEIRDKGTYTSPDHVIRAYWRRVRQPRLPEC